MDDKKPPEDILDAILNRTPDSAPRPTSYPPEFHPPAPEDIPLPPVTAARNSGSDWAAKLLPWLCLMLAAALLVLGVCVLQVVKVNDRLDELQQAVEAVQSVDSLREENKLLQQDVERAQSEKEQITEEKGQLYEIFADIGAERDTLKVQKHLAEFLFYMGRFMDSGDYPMAALAAISADPYFSFPISTDAGPLTVNPAMKDQYQYYRDELIRLGYLNETRSPSGSHFYNTQFSLTLTEEWEPERNSDMAALGILWRSLEAYYVTDYKDIAAQYLVNYQDYPLPGVEGDLTYPKRLQNAASGTALYLYDQLVRDLVDDGYLVETGGVLCYTEQYQYLKEEQYWYSLPFELPTDVFIN